jgi:soluble lytic murein transglycosylase-like protein
MDFAAISMFLVQLCGWPAADYASDVARAAKRYDLDPFVLVSMIRQESHCKPTATGRLGEIGLMQIKRNTLATAGHDRLSDEALREPRLNIMLGARHLHRCLKRCGGALAGALGLYSGRKLKDGVCQESNYSRDILARLARS